MFKLFLDPGHGGFDPGAVGNGLQEKDLTLSISLKIRDILANEYDDVTVRMSRSDDTFFSLTQRTNSANNWKADFYLSVHINSGGGTGFESFVYPNAGAPTTTYQEVIHDEIMKMVGLKDRGKKQGNLHVLRESNMPAILTESGFIDNAADAAKMKDQNWIHAVAKGHVNGLEKAFNLKRKANTVKTIYFFTGGYTGEDLAEIQMFLASNKWWFEPSRNNDGSLNFLVGGFGEGSEGAVQLEKFLKDNNWWYRIQ